MRAMRKPGGRKISKSLFECESISGSLGKSPFRQKPPVEVQSSLMFLNVQKAYANVNDPATTTIDVFSKTQLDCRHTERRVSKRVSPFQVTRTRSIRSNNGLNRFLAFGKGHVLPAHIIQSERPFYRRFGVAAHSNKRSSLLCHFIYICKNE